MQEFRICRILQIWRQMPFCAWPTRTSFSDAGLPLIYFCFPLLCCLGFGCLFAVGFHFLFFGVALCILSKQHMPMYFGTSSIQKFLVSPGWFKKKIIVADLLGKLYNVFLFSFQVLGDGIKSSDPHGDEGELVYVRKLELCQEILKFFLSGHNDRKEAKLPDFGLLLNRFFFLISLFHLFIAFVRLLLGLSERRKAMSYKTVLCDSFKKFGFCKFGPKCLFAHGEIELRLPPQVSYFILFYFFMLYICVLFV